MFQSTTHSNGTVSFAGRLDAAQADKANEALSAITASSTIDFQELEYISSAGLGILLSNQKRLRAKGNGLKLINLNKYIRDIFMYTGFDRLFEIE